MQRSLIMNRTVLLGSLFGLCFLAATFAGGGAAAKPNHPVNAAQTDSGTGCLVRDANGAYIYDASCEWHTVVRRDRDGNLVLYSYHDHGNLPANAPHPTSASQNNGPWPGCLDGIHEVTSPSGEYRSDCRFHN
jgi:hypothetical protein